MKRTFALLAALMLVAMPVLAQTNDYNQNQPQSTTTDQSTTDQTATDNTLTDDNTTSDQSLPSTASPLPLLSVSAIGTLAAGFWFARRRRG